MRRIIFISALLILLPLDLASGQTPGEREQAAKPTLRPPIERFNGTTKFRVRNQQGQEQLVEVQVSIHNWIINGGQKIAALPFPAQGYLITQLRGGKLTTIINGQRQSRREDEFWTVPSEKLMGLETDNDSAVIQTVVIRAR
jgi:hypothetical protein